MSDSVEDAQTSTYEEEEGPRRVDHEQEEDVEVDEEDHGIRKPKKTRRMEEDEEEDEERDEEEDEDEEEEDEEDGSAPRKKRRKTRKTGLARFIDLEAEVDDEDEEDEEDEEYSRDRDFITEGAEGDDSPRRATHHQRLDRRQQELTDADLARLAEDFQERYRQSHAAIPYSGDMNSIPQRLLMPSVEDASLWQVKCRHGKEREIVFNLMRKALEVEFTAKPLNILSVFQRDNLQGIIYVEARSAKDVRQAIEGLYGVFKTPPLLVPIDEMPPLLLVKKKVSTVAPGTWVRIKRGKYQGDLAQVIDVSENGEEAGLKFIPRIDLTPRDEIIGPDGKKRKKISSVNIHTRPPQRFFNFEEVAKVWDRKAIAKRGNAYVFGQDTYKNGFIEKDIKTSALITEDVNPTLEEITMFAKQEGPEGGEGNLEASIDLSIIANAAKKAAISVLQPGDHVEVFEGEQSGVQGSVESITNDIATLRVEGFDLENQRVEVPAKSVRKRFRVGDHVKVMSGKNQDETGLVVAVEENIVTFISDMTNKEVSVFSKDIREAAEVGASTNIVGNYELHDLVQLDASTVGVIYKTERDSFRVLDQNGQVRLVQPHQITTRRDSHRAVATDSQGHEIRPGDNMKESEGEQRAGIVIHIHQSYFTFLHNREFQENGGVFVTRARGLMSVAPKNIAKPAASLDLSKLNPSLNGAMNQGGVVGSNVFRGPRDRVIGYQVTIVKGVNKSHIGIIKDTNGPMVRVELATKNKVVSIERTKLKRRLPSGKLVPLDAHIKIDDSEYNNMPPPPSRFGAGKTPNPYADGGRTPGWGAGAGRTPNPYADSGRTPGWGSKTPNPYTDGGKTPAWSANSKTPNPYADGGKTPAWNAGSKTPNPYASAAGGGGWGGATPGRGASGWGGATPGRGASGWGNATPARPGWGGATPARSGWGADGDTGAGTSSWGDNTYSASTPASAPTPGFGGNAPTPGAWNAPTPSGYAAPTPGPPGYSAPTPGVGGYSAQTPWSAPTPGYGMSSTPASASTPFIRDSIGTSRQAQTFDLDPLWLVDARLKRAGYHVIVNGAMGSTYSEHEGSKGIVLSIFEAGRDGSSTAQVRLHSSGKTLPQIPIEYLAPDHPTLAHEQVVPLIGSRKGELLKVQSVEPNSQFIISTPDIDRISEEHQKALCKWSDPTSL